MTDGDRDPLGQFWQTGSRCDSFTYAAADGLRTSEPVTVTIDVTAPTAVTVAGGGGAEPGVCWSSWLPNSYAPSDRVVPSCMLDLPRRMPERD
ncbi:hypothetical protein DVS77_14245 [Mycolicibacterium moriokaense]|nr:hypothetical protein DVS77_14245 [Mycolicibacterium moriokaense]